MYPDPRGYYAALHLTPAATQADIQRAFRALIRAHHPDVGAGRAGAAEAGAADGSPPGTGTSGAGSPVGGDDAGIILDAFAVLRNPRARAEYDREGQAAETGTGRADSGSRADGATAACPRVIPVHHRKTQGPALRVTPVRWERGPR
jgi:curved DNA-binding protein CbpA